MVLRAGRAAYFLTVLSAHFIARSDRVLPWVTTGHIVCKSPASMQARRSYFLRTESGPRPFDPASNGVEAEGPDFALEDRNFFTPAQAGVFLWGAASAGKMDGAMTLFLW